MRTALGIEIRKDVWNLSYLRKTVSGVRFEGCISMPVSSFPFKSPEAEKEFLDELKKFVLEAGLKTEEIIVGLPTEVVIYKTLKIPAARKTDIRQILSFEIERHLPFYIEDAYYDYQILRKEDGAFIVLIAISKKAILDNLYGLLEKAMLRPTSFEVAPFSIANALSSANEISQSRNIAMLTVGPKEIGIDTLQTGIPISSRTFPLDGHGINQIEKGLKLSTLSLDLPPAEKRLDKVIILSSGNLKSEDVKTVTKKMGISAFTELPLGKMKILTNGIQPESLNSASIATCIALSGIEKQGIHINLIPPSHRIAASRLEKTMPLILTALIIFLGIVSILSIVIKERINLSKINNKLEEIRPALEEVYAINQKLTDIEGKLNSIIGIKLQHPSKLDMMVELATILPPDTWLTNLEYSKGVVHIGGFSSSASSLLPILEASRHLENVEFVGPITTGIEGKEKFRIKAKIKGAKRG